VSRRYLGQYILYAKSVGLNVVCRLGEHVVPKKGIFYYLGLMLQKDGDIDEDVSHIIKID
jgi:hypothetical protein